MDLCGVLYAYFYGSDQLIYSRMLFLTSNEIILPGVFWFYCILYSLPFSIFKEKMMKNENNRHSLT